MSKQKQKKTRSQNIVSSFKGYVNETPKGEKKDMKKPMKDKYFPADVEASWYDWWEKKGLFKAENNSKKENFVIMLPPPNVTGSLHIGHALTSAVEDCLIRYNKMNGKNCLYLPGIDHAGIATQVVVEKTLFGKTGQTRHDLGREKFVEKVWEWKEEYGNRINTQLRRMGSALDWSRKRFTMDPKYYDSVMEAFIRMYKMGYIVRKRRLVNWDCTLNTAISNIEVDHVEITGKRMHVPGYTKTIKFGYLWTFGYPIENSEEKLFVSTTRPETMLGDTAVAIHPDDERYKHLHGKFVIHPFNGRRIPIICDKELVKMEFGTGAVKVTPAHDQDDFDCGKRNNLEFINLINDDGTINENGKPFNGMKRYDVRELVIQGLTEKGLFVEEKPYTLKFGICSRSKDVIEPLIKPQWYMDCTELAKRSCDAVRNKELIIVPEIHEKKWFDWLENIHPWCISRQLWWGHRVPAYFVKRKGISQIQEDENRLSKKYWIVARDIETAKKEAIEKFKLKEDEFTLEQDEDVLDTWFSSGIFPFATLGWPEKTQDLSEFFPGTLLETGSDILFFWVARMVMMSLALTEKLPFKYVYLHNMVRDKSGKKMSKSDGNVIDPIDCVEGITLKDLHEKLDSLKQLDKKKRERGKKLQKKQFPRGITESGTDALRFTLLNYTTNSGVDINMDVDKVFGYRAFCNKIWNAMIYARDYAGLKEFKPKGKEFLKEGAKLFINKWILNYLNETIEKIRTAFKTWSFAVYTDALYEFFVKNFCDVYLEVTKLVINGDNEEHKLEVCETLFKVFDTFLKLLHPTMPFLSEELWNRLNFGLGIQDTESILQQSYPTLNENWKADGVEEEMRLLLKTCYEIRSIKGRYNLSKKKLPPVFIKIAKHENMSGALRMKQEKKSMESHAQSGDITFVDGELTDEQKKGCVSGIVNENIVVFVYLQNMMDIDLELKKVAKSLKNKRDSKARTEKRINSPNFKKSPKNIQEKAISSVETLTKEIEVLEGLENQLNSWKSEK